MGGQLLPHLLRAAGLVPGVYGAYGARAQHHVHPGTRPRLGSAQATREGGRVDADDVKRERVGGWARSPGAGKGIKSGCRGGRRWADAGRRVAGAWRQARCSKGGRGDARGRRRTRSPAVSYLAARLSLAVIPHGGVNRHASGQSAALRMASQAPRHATPCGALPVRAPAISVRPPPQSTRQGQPRRARAVSVGGRHTRDTRAIRGEKRLAVGAPPAPGERGE